MSIVTIPDRWGLRGGTAADLATVNEIPLKREAVIEDDTGKIKVGDGVTHWNDLDYINTPPGGGGSGTVFGGGVAGAGFGAGTDSLIGNVVSLIPFDTRNNTVGFVDLCGNPLIDFNKVRGDSSKQQYGKNTMKNEGGGLSVFSSRGAGSDLFLNSIVIGTQDFCWEIDFAVSGTLGSFNSLISNRPNNGSTGGTVAVGITSANQLYVYANSAFVVAASAATAVSSPTAFHKLRYEVVSGTGYLYLDGTRIGSGTQAAVYYTSKLAIGANSDISETAACNFANFRYTLGANRSAGASSYTPATGQFPFA